MPGHSGIVTELLRGEGIPEKWRDVDLAQVIGCALSDLMRDPTWGGHDNLRPEAPRYTREEKRLKLPRRQVADGSDECICGLCRLYRDEAKTLEEIARAMQACKTTISRWVKEHGTVVSRSLQKRRRERS